MTYTPLVHSPYSLIMDHPSRNILTSELPITNKLILSMFLLLAFIQLEKNHYLKLEINKEIFLPQSQSISQYPGSSQS